MASAGKGLPFIGKMNDFLDKVLHPTVNKVGNSKAAIDVTPRAFFCVNGISTPLTVEAGSTDNILKKTAHTAKPGDVIRILTTANGILETEISVDSIVDADNLMLAGYLSANLAAGDTFHLLRPTMNLVSSDGSSMSTVSVPPITYNRKSAGSTAPVTVLEDLDTPSASKPLPVAIHSIDGAGITVNAGDLSVSTSHVNDSMAIGDGTTLAGVTLTNELKVSLPASQITTLTPPAAITGFALETGGNLAEIKTNTDNIPAPGQALEAASMPVVLTALQVAALTPPAAITGFALETGGNLAAIKTNTDNLDVALSTRNAEATQALIKAKTDNLDVALSTVAKDATLLASNTLLGAVNESAPASDTASSGLNGRLQRIAQNISAMILQLPASLGIKTAANSLSIAPASDAVFTIKDKPLTGSYAEITNLTTVQTFTAPANAIGALVQADDTNSVNFRAKQGAAATASSGIQFQAGRSEKFESGSDISVCSESSSVKVYVQWFLRA